MEEQRQQADPSKTIVVGVGNPVLTDDAVGVCVARALQTALHGRAGVTVAELHVGGMALMEALIGFDRAIVVDCMTAGEKPGTVYRVDPREAGRTRNSACAHNTSLSVALDIGRHLRLPLPSEIEVWGIEPKDVETFGEELSVDVAKAVPYVVDGILRAVDRPPANGEHRENRRLLL